MNKLLNYIVSGLFLLLIACSPDDELILDQRVSADDIKIIELRADHNTLIANGNSFMEFHAIAYGANEIKHLIYQSKTKTYKDTITLDTFVIPNDQLPNDFIKVFDEQGKELEGNKFSTDDALAGSLEFTAKAGLLESKPISIKLRNLPASNYEEVVYPIIFHLLIPPVSSGPAYSVPEDKLQDKIDKLNLIYNQINLSNPNGGNAKISFKLAEYDKYGKPLKIKGVNMVQLKEELSANEIYEYINDNLIWDSNKYLNVWLTKFASSWSETGANSYKSVAPTVILSSADAISGLTADAVESFDNGDITDFTDVGIMVNYKDFLNANRSTGDGFELSTIVGYYLGLLSMDYYQRYGYVNGKYTSITNFVDGDTDFCSDTYMTDKADLIFKKSYITEEWFTGCNIMIRNSRKNSITYDQVQRVRQIIESCPSRWSYKSDWAFTGK